MRELEWVTVKAIISLHTGEQARPRWCPRWTGRMSRWGTQPDCLAETQRCAVVNVAGAWYRGTLAVHG